MTKLKEKLTKCLSEVKAGKSVIYPGIESISLWISDGRMDTIKEFPTFGVLMMLVESAI